MKNSETNYPSNEQQRRSINSWFSIRLGGASRLLTVATLLALTFMGSRTAQSQAFTVIHNFTGGQDGEYPLTGLTMDAVGNFYGMTSEGGGSTNCPSGCGTVFQLKRAGPGWVFNTIYRFAGGNDGAYPTARRLTIGPDGLYGTTAAGGVGSCVFYLNSGCGTVFKLTPPLICQSSPCQWDETVLYRFAGGSDGAIPYGGVILDQAGKLYGTTQCGGQGSTIHCLGAFGDGGANGNGTVYELTPSNGVWTKSILYTFAGEPDGSQPFAPVTFDKSGNLYGTTFAGGEGCGALGCGTVYELSHSNGVWLENTLYRFQDGGDGANPQPGLIFDHSGNIYSATSQYERAGSGGNATVFELSPSGNGSWSFNVLHTFAVNPVTGCEFGCGPTESLFLDAAGSLYGTTYFDGTLGYGSIFKLARLGGGWSYTGLHNFSDGSDGGYVADNVTRGSNGILYGVTEHGGLGSCELGCGVIFAFTPPNVIP